MGIMLYLVICIVSGDLYDTSFQVDAHGDINTPSESSSGNMHGMPVAFLMGLVKNASSLPGFGWFKPCLAPQDLVYIGLRDLDPAEKVTIRRLGIKAFTVSGGAR